MPVNLAPGQRAVVHVGPGVSLELTVCHHGRVNASLNHSGFKFSTPTGFIDSIDLVVVGLSTSGLGTYCDRCLRQTEVRRLDTGGSGAHLCPPCWGAEMAWREKRNAEGVANPYAILPWAEGLEVRE